MSNKYFRDWQSSNTSKSTKSEISHLEMLKKLDADNARLDRALDKIKTEEKTAKIFNQSQHIHTSPQYLQYLQSPQYLQSQQSQQSQCQVHTRLGFVNLGSPYVQPVHLTCVSDKFIVVNGCVVMHSNGFF